MSAEAGAHRRRNPLTGRWVVVSTGRTDRPWKGKVGEGGGATTRPAYDPDCYLCPGNERAGGARNPDYDSTFVFTNDFPAIRTEPFLPDVTDSELMVAEPVTGTCRVICFSPRHDLTLSRMEPEGIRGVVDTWAEQERDLGREYAWVQVFENSGAEMGSSIPHPHGQLWATSVVPTEVALEDSAQRDHLATHGTTLLGDYLATELGNGSRIVVETDGWVALVPFWAVWPFETLLLPKGPVGRIPDLDPSGRDDLALLVKALLSKYDNLFEAPFPYSLGWHGAPHDGGDHAHWRLHGHVYPPLLRSPTIRKHMVGFELLAEAQRDLSPEEAAERLRSLPTAHHADAEA